MKGSEVEIRDVDDTYKGWAEGSNPHLETLRRAADKKLERFVKIPLKSLRSHTANG